MVSVDYTYYTTTYLGDSVSSTEFPKLLKQSQLYLSKVTFNRADEITDDDTNTSLVTALKDCLCSIVDTISVFKSNNGGVVTSESVGQWSVNYNVDSLPASMLDSINSSADLYLGKYNLTCMWI